MPQSRICKPLLSKNQELVTKLQQKRHNHTIRKRVNSYNRSSSSESLISCRNCNSFKYLDILSITSSKTDIFFQRYESLAALYKINLSTVKKYYSILTNIPEIPVHKIITIKKNRSKQEITSLKKGTVSNLVSHNHSTCFQRLSTKTEEKIFAKNSEIQKFPQNTNQTLQISLPTTSIKKCNLAINSLNDESKIIRCTKRVRTTAKSPIRKNGVIITNPFFQNKRKATKNSKNLQSVSDKDKSFWTQKFSDSDPATKKKKFIETFKKIKIKKDKGITDKKNILLKTNPIKIKENEGKNKLKKRIKNYKQEKAIKSSSSLDLSINSSIKSLSVHCQSLIRSKNIKSNHSSNLIQCNILKSHPPKSFGNHLLYQKQDISDDFNTNISQNHAQFDEYLTDILNNANKIEEELDNLNDSCVSLDTTNSRVTSNIMLSNNVISSSDLKNARQANLQSKLKGSSLVVKSKRLESLCSNSVQTSTNSIKKQNTNINGKNSSLNQFEINGTMKCPTNSTYTTLNKMKKSNNNKEFPQMKLVNEEGLNQYQMINNVDESFDSLCNVVSKLSKNENITIYKENQDDTAMETDKTVLRLSNNNFKNSDLETPIICKKNTIEIYSSTKNTSRKSPITYQQSSRLNLSSKLSPTSNPENIRNSLKDRSMLQSQQNPNIIKKTIQLNPSITVDNVTQNSENEKDYSTIRIIDPRIRKRKVNENNIVTQLVKDIEVSQKKRSRSHTFSIHRGSLNHLHDTEKKISVFQRLGIKQSKTSTLYKSVEDMSTELLNIDTEKSETKKSTDYESDDDWLSLHPCEVFSSDEDSSTSPRHRKFTSERIHVNEIRNQSISIKDRLNWNVPCKNRKTFESKLSMSVNTDIIKDTAEGGAQPLIQVPNNQHFIGMLPNTSNATTAAVSFSEYSNNDIVFNEKFYKMNTAQMLQDVNNFESQQLESNIYAAFGNNVMEKTCKFDYISMLNGSNKSLRTGINETKNNFFKNYCFKKLRIGNCVIQDKCCYNHKMDLLCNQIKLKNLHCLFNILNFAIRNGFEHFIVTVWSSILLTLQNDAFSVYKQLYRANMRSESFIHDLLNFCLNTKLHSVESFVKKISSVIEQDDRETVRIICEAVKTKLIDGFCWEAMKDLCQRAVPPRDIIELILIQCLRRRKNDTHIAEVYNMVKNKLNPLERNQISQSVLKPFFTLAHSKVINKETLNVKPFLDVTSNNNNQSSQSVDTIHSVEIEKPTSPVLQVPVTATVAIGPRNKKIETPQETSILSPQQPHNSPLEVLITTPNKGESTNFSDYVVTKIDSDEPQSLYRNNFWKLYLTVHNVKEGLNHVDYEYVWKVMDEFSKEKVQDELLRRAYYHILCKNVKSCEHHVSEVIKQAVRCRWSTSRKSIDILFDVGVYALIDLANNEFWVMALQLLSFVKILEPDESKTTFVLISVEIYLANNDPLEALYLMQRTRLLKTNRDEWLTNDSTKEDEKHRSKLVFILLEALSYIDPEKAVYLFKTIMTDQYTAYYPIDLVCYLDKLMLLLVLQNKDELISDFCRTVMDNDLTFKKSVYQELLRQILPVDEILSNQILEYAIRLGYYNDIQIRNGFTTVIIDMNCSQEELYLILKRLINKLIHSIGPVIEHLTPHQLKVTLIFEDIPAEKRLYINETAIMIKEKYKGIRRLVSTILTTRFTPPIKIAHKRADKFCQIVSRTLVNYLKYWNETN